MKRWLFNFAAVLSLLLCLATVTMWVRGYFAGDEFSFCDNTIEQEGDHGDLARYFVAHSASGLLQISITDEDDRNGIDFDLPVLMRPAWAFQHSSTPPGPSNFQTMLTGHWRYHWHGFALGSEEIRGIHVTGAALYMTAPYWSLALLFGFVSAVALRPIVRRYKSYPASLCDCCGYDLRATPNRCPECGRSFVIGSGDLMKHQSSLVPVLFVMTACAFTGSSLFAVPASTAPATTQAVLDSIDALERAAAQIPGEDLDGGNEALNALRADLAWHAKTPKGSLRTSEYRDGQPDVAMRCDADLIGEAVMTCREVYGLATEASERRKLDDRQSFSLTYVAQHLPPSMGAPTLERVVVVTVHTTGPLVTRIYDRAHLRPEIVRISDLAGAGLFFDSPWTADDGGHCCDDMSSHIFGVEGKITAIGKNDVELRSLTLHVTKALDTAIGYRPEGAGDVVAIRFDEKLPAFNELHLREGSLVRIYFGEIDSLRKYGSNSSWMAVAEDGVFHNREGKAVGEDNFFPQPRP